MSSRNAGVCLVCGKSLADLRPNSGRPRKYCSVKCRQTAYSKGKFRPDFPAEGEPEARQQLAAKAPLEQDAMRAAFIEATSPRSLTTGELADLLSVSDFTVRRWRALPAYHAEVQKWVKLDEERLSNYVALFKVELLDAAREAVRALVEVLQNGSERAKIEASKILLERVNARVDELAATSTGQGGAHQTVVLMVGNGGGEPLAAVPAFVEGQVVDEEESPNGRHD